MFVPFETARAAKAAKNATSAVSAIGIGRATRVRCHVSVPFGCRSVRDDDSPDEARCGNKPDRLDDLGEHRKALDRFDVGVDDRETGRDHEQIADDQTGEDRHRRGERDRRRAPRQDDCEHPEQDGRDDEAGFGAGAFPEVLRDESRVDSGADGADKNDGVGAQSGERHWTITDP